jgi:RimJ/RimL family protein N-acetyltransferase
MTPTDSIITGTRIRLRGKKLADAVDDYAWHTDPELVELDAALLLKFTFPQYLSAFLEDLRYQSPKRCAFAIETLTGLHIGNCSYYDISKNRDEAQLGIMIGNRDYWDKGYGTEVVTTLLGHIFRTTGIKRVYLKTLLSNVRAQRCFQKCGFTHYGQQKTNGHHFLLMEIRRKEWSALPLAKPEGAADRERPGS